MTDIDKELYGVDLFGEPVRPDNPNDGILSERFGLPPFSVLNAREGWWQERKRAWLALGIQSELGRGGDMLGNGGGNTSKEQNATPGGSLMPATNYSRSGKRGNGRGQEID